MAYATFDDLAQELFRLYEEKQFDTALTLLTPEIAHYPDEARHTRYWQACFLSLLGREPEAVAALQVALDQGASFPPSMLLEDPDLEAIREVPAFQAIVTTCRQRQAEAQARAVPVRQVIRPESAEAPHPLLIALHGNNSNAANTAPHWQPAADACWLLAVLQSAQAAATDTYVWNDRDWAVREVAQHYAELTREFPVDLARTVVGGFSMGGGTAIWLALSQAIPVRGFVALGPWIGTPELLRPLLEERRGSGLRGCIICGEHDQQCINSSREVAALMAEYGLACELEIVPGLGHTYPADFGDRLLKGLSFVLGR